MDTKPVAKSLHTVTVIVQVARAQHSSGGLTPGGAISLAMSILDLANRPDPYGLRDKALAMLNKGA